MANKSESSKTKAICGECGETFVGKKCPECGNQKGNMELSSDGIPKDEHKMDRIFGSASRLRPADKSLDQEFLMNQEMATNQHAELSDNLRESFVIKSQLKKLELEAKLKEKKEQLEPVYTPRTSAPAPEPQQVQMQNPFQQAVMNPQAQFMNQFMKMNTEDRTELLEGLADADPSALAVLSGFFTQPQPQQQQMPTNPYIQAPMNPYQQFPPPWAQGQQQQYEQPPRKDPAETAIDMVEKIQAISERNKNNEPSESAAIVSALREELREMNERISQMSADKQNNENNMLLQRIGQMETHMLAPKPTGGFKEQVREIKEMVSDLQDIGMMDRPASIHSVDEQIQLSRAQHDIKKEDREIALAEQQLTAQKADKDMKSSLVSGLFKRQFSKTTGPSVEQAVPQPTQPMMVSQERDSAILHKSKVPINVVEEFQSDAGSVRETRAVSGVPDDQ